MASATSPGVADRPSGTVAPMRSARPGVPLRACISVSAVPGHTAFTRIPAGPSSFASPSVRVSTPPFAAA